MREASYKHVDEDTLLRATSGCSLFKDNVFNIVDFFGNFIVQGREFFHLIARVHNRRVVSTAQNIPYGNQGEGEHFTH